VTVNEVCLIAQPAQHPLACHGSCQVVAVGHEVFEFHAEGVEVQSQSGEHEPERLEVGGDDVGVLIERAAQLGQGLRDLSIAEVAGPGHPGPKEQLCPGIAEAFGRSARWARSCGHRLCSTAKPSSAARDGRDDAGDMKLVVIRG
jgi:hypothetical protein